MADVIGPPTADDLARDAAHDLAVCGVYFGFHDEGCNAVWEKHPGPPECDCGLDAARAALPAWVRRARAAEEQAHRREADLNNLLCAVLRHHEQKADDRCREDDDRLHAAAGLPPCDRRVGDKAAMLANCARFIERRCEGGHWPSYADLEAEVARLREALKPFAFVVECAEDEDCHPLRECLERLGLDVPTFGNCREAARVLGSSQ